MCYSVDKSAGPREVAVMGQVAALYSGRNPKVRLYIWSQTENITNNLRLELHI